MDESRFDVVWPRGKSQAGENAVESRLKSLSGQRVGFIWSHGFRGDEMFELLKEEIVARYADVEFVDHPTFGNIHGPDEREVVAALPQRLAESGITAAVLAVAA